MEHTQGIKAALLFQYSLFAEILQPTALVARISSRFYNWMTNSLLVEILELTDLTWICMLILSIHLPPLSTNSHLRNNWSVNNEHLRIAYHCHKARESNHMWKRQLSIIVHMAWQVHNSTLPLQYIVALPDEQFIFSSSWLPSQRFEQRNLAGYFV